MTTTMCESFNAVVTASAIGTGGTGTSTTNKPNANHLNFMPVSGADVIITDADAQTNAKRAADAISKHRDWLNTHERFAKRADIEFHASLLRESTMKARTFNTGHLSAISQAYLRNAILHGEGYFTPSVKIAAVAVVECDCYGCTLRDQMAFIDASKGSSSQFARVYQCSGMLNAL